MPTITLTLPVAGTAANAGPIATNFSNLQALLNGGLDSVNLANASVGLSELAATGTPSATTFLRGDNSWAAAGAMVRLYDNVLVGTAASWDVTTGLTGYNQLKVLLQARGDTAATSIDVRMRCNNDSGANYGSQYVRGIAAAASAAEAASATSAHVGNIAAASATASHAGVGEIWIPNYGGTTFFKGWNSNLGWSQAITTSTIAAQALQGVWANTAAITRLTIFPSAGAFIAGSRLSIYGIL